MNREIPIYGLKEKMSDMSKGQFLSILVIVTLLFISGGSMFTTLFAKNQLNYVWSIYTGDHRQIAETYAKADTYPLFLSNNVGYAIDNAAYELGKNGSDRTWNKSQIPTEEELFEDYNDTIVGHSEYGIRSQNYYAGCSVPNIEQYSIEENWGAGVGGAATDGYEFAYNMDSNLIKCGKSGFDSKAIKEMENFAPSRRPNYDRDYFISNNYIELSRYAINLSMEIREVMDQTQTWGTATGTTDECDPNSEDRQNEKEDVHQDARENAVDNIVGVVEDAVDNTDKSSYISVYSDESASWWPREDNPNNVSDVPCSLTHTHDNGTCLSEDCDGAYYPPPVDDTIQHSHSDYRGAAEGDCDDYDCKTHTHPHSQDEDELVKKEYDYNVSLSTYYGDIGIRDEDRKFVVHAGERYIPFNYTYTHTINPGWPY